MRRGLFTADEEAGERGGFVNQYFDSEFTVGVKGDELFNKQKNILSGCGMLLDLLI